MKQRLFALAAAVVMALGLTACGGSGSSEGRTGDTMETYFFDFTVNSAYLTSDYAGRTPGEGNVLLVADITVKNTFEQSIEMYDTDFQVQWDDGDDAYAYPITTDMETYGSGAGGGEPAARYISHGRGRGAQRRTGL